MLEPAGIDQRVVPWLGVLGGLVLAIWSIYWDTRRRLPNRHSGLPPAVSRPPYEEDRSRARLRWALALVALGWLGRYVADRFGGGLALIGYGCLAAGIAMLAGHVAARISSASPEDGVG